MTTHSSRARPPIGRYQPDGHTDSRAATQPSPSSLEPFEDAYAKTDWSRFQALPAFEQANRANAYGTYLLLEQEELQRTRR